MTWWSQSMLHSSHSVHITWFSKSSKRPLKTFAIVLYVWYLYIRRPLPGLENQISHSNCNTFTLYRNTFAFHQLRYRPPTIDNDVVGCWDGEIEWLIFFCFVFVFIWSCMLFHFYCIDLIERRRLCFVCRFNIYIRIAGSCFGSQIVKKEGNITFAEDTSFVIIKILIRNYIENY